MAGEYISTDETRSGYDGEIELGRIRKQPHRPLKDRRMCSGHSRQDAKVLTAGIANVLERALSCPAGQAPVTVRTVNQLSITRPASRSTSVGLNPVYLAFDPKVLHLRF